MFLRLLNPAKVVGSVLLLLAMLCCPRAGKAQTFDLLDNRKRVNIPFRMVRDMVIIQLRINNKGPFNFILDTGVGIMIITNPAMVDSIALLNKRVIKIFGFGEGNSFEAYATPQLKIDVQGLSSHDISAAILKEEHFGLSNYAGIPIQGLIGYDFFNSLAVKFNFNDSTLTVSKPEDMRLFRKGYMVPVIIDERKPYLIARVKYPNGSVFDKKLVVDIGAGHPLSLENMLNENGLPDKFIAGNLGVGLSGPITGFISRISEIDIGKFALKDVITSFPDKDYLTREVISVPRDGNLGLGILKRFQIIFDYTNHAIYLKKGILYNEPFEHDMSGMEYYSDAKHVFISRVEPGSPADEVGIKKDDEITAINFTSIQDFSLEHIDNLLRSRNDRSLLIEVYRDKKYIKFILTLKRRV